MKKRKKGKVYLVFNESSKGYTGLFNLRFYPLFAYDAYDLSELVFYTMIIPIAYWGYQYFKDKRKID